MTILEKWETIDHNRIKIGDKIKRVNIHADGTHVEVSGVVQYENVFGDLLSEGGFSLVRKDYPDTRTELSILIPPTQEELDEAFEFPTAPGAIIDVVLKNSGEKRTFVYSGQVWIWSGTQYPASLAESGIRRVGHHFTLVSEGHK